MRRCGTKVANPAYVVHPVGQFRAKSAVRQQRRKHHVGARQASALVLVHPFAASPEVWNPILPMLQREHEVFSLSIPGHLGAEPVTPGFAFTVTRVVDVLERKLDALGLERAHIVGNSLGGWLAIELARRGRASSVVAIAPGGGWQRGSAAHRRLARKFIIMGALLQLGGPLATLLSASALTRGLCLRDAVARPGRMTPFEAQRFIEAAWRCEAFTEVVKALGTQPLSDPFELPCRVRLVWGDQDRVLPMRGYSEHWRTILPDAEWVVLNDVGHVPMYDDPEAVARAILDVTASGFYAPQRRLAS